jgi:drug/metabolite transporter (DMT)-like permease
MSEQAFAILLAVTFTFGCAAIHALKQQAQAVTAVLSIVVLCLGAIVVLVSLAQKTEPSRRTERHSIAWSAQ